MQIYPEAPERRDPFVCPTGVGYEAGHNTPTDRQTAHWNAHFINFQHYFNISLLLHKCTCIVIITQNSTMMPFGTRTDSGNYC